MTKLKNFLRCYAMGMSIKSISCTFLMSRNTVRKYRESDMSLEQMLSLTEEKQQELFLEDRHRNRKVSARKAELEELVPEYVKRLGKRGVTVK